MQKQKDGLRKNLKSYLPSCFRISRVVKKKWIDTKVYNTMRDVDIQVEEIKKTWDEEKKSEIIETPSEVKGLNDMEIGKFN